MAACFEVVLQNYGQRDIKFNFLDLVEVMTASGLSMAHTALMRRGHHYGRKFERRRNRFGQPAGVSFHVHETCVRVHGEWVHLKGSTLHIGAPAALQRSSARRSRRVKSSAARPRVWGIRCGRVVHIT